MHLRCCLPRRQLIHNRTQKPLSSTLSRMAVEYFVTASGNMASCPVWCDYREMSHSAKALCRRQSVPLYIVIFSLISHISYHSLCTIWQIMSLTLAAREYRHKQKTLLMRCFKLCKSCCCGRLWFAVLVWILLSVHCCVKYKYIFPCHYAFVAAGLYWIL